MHIWNDLFEVLSSKEKPAGQLLGFSLLWRVNWGIRKNRRSSGTLKNRARWRMHPGLWEKAWLRLMSGRGNIRENINMGKKELKRFLSVSSFGISSRTVLIWLSLNAFRMDGLSSLRIQVRAGTGPGDVLYMGCTWVLSCSVVSNSAVLWTVDHQAPLSKGFSRQEYWSVLPFPPPPDLSRPRHQT